MKKLMLLALLTGMLTALTGCGYFTQFDNFENSTRLRIGMSKEQVRSIMGEPLQEPFCTADVWYYYIDTKWHDGQSTRDECMPLVFKKGKLAGWGNDYYKQEKLLKKQYERPAIEGLK